MTAKTQAIALFEDRFGTAAAAVVRSPGRVNLMGDHTDYNAGLSLPMAIEMATWIAFSAASDATVEAVSANDDAAVAFELGSEKPVGGWGNYVQGTVRALGCDTGFKAALASDLPIGAGLSSSASVEMGIARLIAEITAVAWDPMAAALAGRSAENEWVGVATGLLDQISVSHAVAGKALLIDFESLEVSPVAIPPGATVVILDGGGQRQLTKSEYGVRRATCERAAARLGLTSLRKLSVADLPDIDLPDLEMRRVRHVVTENDRVRRIVAAFAAHDLTTAGQIMVQSHTSLRDDYQVAGENQEAVVAAALRSPGVLGARMTGGGFAGTAVALVDDEALPAFLDAMEHDYQTEGGKPPMLAPTSPAAAVAVEPIGRSETPSTHHEELVTA